MLVSVTFAVACVETDKAFISDDLADISHPRLETTAPVERTMTPAARGCAQGADGRLMDASMIEFDDDRSPPPVDFSAGLITRYGPDGNPIDEREESSQQHENCKFTISCSIAISH